MGLGLTFLVEGGKDGFNVFCFVAAFASVFAAGWTFHVHTGKRLSAALLIVSIAAMLGAVLVSIAVMRSHWFEIVKETLGLVTTLR